MAQTLRDIVEEAAQSFPDHFLQKQLDNKLPSNLDDLTLTETLAAYLVKEFKELYSPNSSDAANLARIVTSLERTVHLLENVIEQLEQLKEDEA